MTLNPEIKTEWVKRLRDGRPQISGDLHTIYGQCCLGVLCQMAAEQDVISSRTANDWTVYVDNLDEQYTSIMPSSVARWAGFKSDDDLGDIEERRVNGIVINSLAEANDAGLNFDQIADIIENEL